MFISSLVLIERKRHVVHLYLLVISDFPKKIMLWWEASQPVLCRYDVPSINVTEIHLTQCSVVQCRNGLNQKTVSLCEE